MHYSLTRLFVWRGAGEKAGRYDDEGGERRAATPQPVAVVQQMSGAGEERNATAARERHRSLVPAPEVITDADGDDYDDEEWNPDPLSPATEYIHLNSGEPDDLKHNCKVTHR